MSILSDIPEQTSCESFTQTMVDQILKQPGLLEEFWQFALTSDPGAWKAVWIMDKLNEIRPDLIQPYLKLMLENVEHLKQSGQKRHMLKLISLYPLPDEPTGSFINFCFDLLQDRSEPVAGRVHAMQVLYNIAQDIPDLRNELRLVIEDAMIEGTPGIISRGRKLLQSL